MSVAVTTTTKLDYNNGENIVPEGNIRVSASGIAQYFERTRLFWGKLMLGETGFTGSTASVLGTCVHYTAEMVGTKGEWTEEDEQEIEKYIQQFENPLDVAYDQEIDCDLIRAQWPIMARTLAEDYLAHNKPVSCEDFLYEELLPGIGVGGSCDAISGAVSPVGKLQNGIIIDYKTTSAKTAPSVITFAHRLQLLTYAWLYTKRGHHVDRIRIVYITRDDSNRISETTGKPLKSYTSTAVAVTEVITPTDLKYIESCINVITDSIDCWQKVPTMRYIIAQDFRLKVAKTDEDVVKSLPKQKGEN